MEITNGSYGIIRNNLFIGNDVGLQLDDSSATVVQNNTFHRQYEDGIRNHGSKVRVSIHNNIFSNPANINARPVVLEDAMVNTGTVAWLGKNLWQLPSFGSPRTFVNSPGVATIIGDMIGIEAGPHFIDSTTLALAPTSPAIDKGDTKVKSFALGYSILDTTVIFQN